MALPKRRHSHRRTHIRRSHDSLDMIPLSRCPQCKEPKLPHRACKSCGYYSGKHGLRQVIKGEEK